MGIPHLIWLAHLIIRASLVLALALLLGVCLATPDSAPGRALSEATAWAGQSATELATALNPVGLRALPGGAVVLCIAGTEGCEQAPIAWPSLELPRLLPPDWQPGRAWLAAGIALATLFAFRRRLAR